MRSDESVVLTTDTILNHIIYHHLLPSNNLQSIPYDTLYNLFALNRLHRKKRIEDKNDQRQRARDTSQTLSEQLGNVDKRETKKVALKKIQLTYYDWINHFQYANEFRHF